MVKKIFFVMMALTLSVAVNAQEWISFGSKAEGAPPEISVQQNDNQAVSFTVTLAGMYATTKVEAQETFQRLSLPECSVFGEVGSPELPVVVKTVAIPECTDVLYTVTVVSQQIFSNYNVYPVPDRQAHSNPDETTYVEEVFTKDVAVYEQNALLPADVYRTLGVGHFRSQHNVQMAFYPIQYNPVTRMLMVATDMEITLTFVNATTPVNVNLGIFNNVATHTMVNYVDQGMKASDNDRAFERPNFSLGSVQWKKLNSPQDVHNITADYLIICAEYFYPSGGQPNAEVLRLADHRAKYNGFDIMILNVNDIMSNAVGFYYEGPNDFKQEQRIRTCIRTVYEKGKANHTGDGKLGYVLLVGKPQTIMAKENGEPPLPSNLPGSYDYGNEGYIFREWEFYHGEVPSVIDHYFSCVNRDASGIYDWQGDLFLGRFCVGNSSQLHNMVEKTIRTETEFGSWKQNVLWANGTDLEGGTPYLNQIADYLRSITPPQNLTHLNAYEEGSEPAFMNALNSILHTGVSYVDWYSHGGVNVTYGGNISTFKVPLENAPHSIPFWQVQACDMGAMNAPYSCFAEAITSYSADKGAVAMFAASSGICFDWEPELQSIYFTKMPHAIFTNMSHITGEFILETKRYFPDHKMSAEVSILFGDPALNIFAEGFEVTRCVTLDANTNVSGQLTVKNGGCLTIPANGVLALDMRGSITVEAGGKIEFGNNAKITSFTEHDPIRFINIQGGTIVAANNSNAKIENINFTIDKTTSTALSNIRFDNVSFSRNNINSADNQVFKMNNCKFFNSSVWLNNHKKNAEITNCTFEDSKIYPKSTNNSIPIVVKFSNSEFTNSPISHSNHQLEAVNCTFSNRSDIIATSPITDIKNCVFWKSGFKATVPSGGISLLFTPFVKITGSSFRNVGTYYTGENSGGGPTYSSAAIMIDNIKEFQITADTIINANASAPKGVVDPGNPVQTLPQGQGIYLNGAGQGNVDNRLISGNDISQCETGLHVYSSKATFKNNDIHNNTSGIRLLNNSSTSFSGDTNPANGKQYIRDNTSHQLYATKGSFPAPFKFNLIRKDNNPHSTPWIYYDVSGKSTTLDVTGNCWGSNFVAATDLYPAGWYDYLLSWCPGAGGKSSSPAEELYQAALDYFAAENYASAKTAFLNLITTYPEDELAIAALHELFAIEQFLSEDYSALHDYYATFTPADTTLFDVADFLATRCNVIDQNWQPAIDWYENRIAEPPSYPDSVFAVIDLGDIHLMMENDSSSLKAGRVLRFPHLIPKSKREYEENKSELLATLPKIEQPKHPLAETGKTGVLSQNIPNPANGSTTVVYDVIKDGQVELRMYNQLGQLLQTLPQGTKKEGTYRTVISLTGLPAGMYHYVLFINGEKADAKKLIVN